MKNNAVVTFPVLLSRTLKRNWFFITKRPYPKSPPHWPRTRRGPHGQSEAGSLWCRLTLGVLLHKLAEFCPTCVPLLVADCPQLGDHPVVECVTPALGLLLLQLRPQLRLPLLVCTLPLLVCTLQLVKLLNETLVRGLQKRRQSG